VFPISNKSRKNANPNTADQDNGKITSLSNFLPESKKINIIGQTSLMISCHKGHAELVK
jgi:hypothetical protein